MPVVRSLISTEAARVGSRVSTSSAPESRKAGPTSRSATRAAWFSTRVSCTGASRIRRTMRPARVSCPISSTPMCTWPSRTSVEA